MLKKIIALSFLFLTTTLHAATYLGLGTGIQINTSDTWGIGAFRGIPLTIVGGYGQSVSDSLYLAGEAFFTIGTADISDSSSMNNSIRTTYSYGAGIIPGIYFGDHTLGFARAGIIRSHFKTQDDNAFGAQIGLGLQTNISPHLDLRGEYIFTVYDSIINASSPKSDQFSLGLIYQFG